ncbi:hypothetical protein ACYX7E_14790 [Luteimonas sp. RIT-PG2_3]
MYAALPAWAQDNSDQPNPMYASVHRNSNAKMTTGGSEFGDQISMQTGTISFNVVDVSLPGNNRLPVEFRRRKVEILKGTTQGAYQNSMVDWEIDLPRVYVVHDSVIGWVTSDSSAPRKNCSVAGTALIKPNEAGAFPAGIQTYWKPPRVHIPGGADLGLQYNVNNMAAPSAGGPYYWLTKDNHYFSCIPTLKNSGGTTAQEIQRGSSEGFLMLAPDGTRYWFDWVATSGITYHSGPTTFLSSAVDTFNMSVAQIELYATRVEDRFGNWVTYSYSNKSTGLVKLDAIESNDGRRIDISYADIPYATDKVSSVSANGRVWTYLYGQSPTPSGYSPSRLTQVTNPDASKWSYHYGSVRHGSVYYADIDFYGCNVYPNLVPDHTIGAGMYERSYAVTAPSGATALFGVSPLIVGRSAVPRQCYAIARAPAMGGGDFYESIFQPINPVATSGFGLTYKKVSGPGLADAIWKYTYTSQLGFLPFTGGTNQGKVLNPDGSYEIHTFGNVFKQNDGLLLSVDTYDAGGVLRRRVANTYELGQGNAAYPKAVGFDPEYRGGSYDDAVLRPLVRSDVIQDGVKFTMQVNSLDSRGRPTSVTRSSAPVP